MRHQRRIGAALCALAVLGAACSSPRTIPGDAQVTPRDRKGAPEDGVAKLPKKGQGKKAGQAGDGKDGGKTGPSGSGPGSAPSDPDDASPPSTGGLQPLGAGGPEFARQSAHYSEPDPDAQKSGVPPDYSEGLAIDVEGLGKDLRITMTFDGTVPQKMPNKDTIMVVGLAVGGKDKDDDGYAFGAQADEEGWHAYAGSKGKTQRFPGTFLIRGEQIVMTIPWSFIDGPRPFEFQGNASWFQNLAGVTSYAFDLLPNNKGRYPN